MHFSTLALAALPLALAAPLTSGISPRQGVTDAADSAGAACKLSGVSQPTSTLPAPASGLQLVLIAYGTGTQNYTCADSTSASKPASIGALAQLFDASCDVAAGKSGAIGSSASIGSHFFADNTTPEFNVASLGNTLLKKTAADSTTPGASNVPWLQLQAQSAGTTSKVKEIYRLSTQGGVAPATCEGQQPTFTVQYSAQYWFYASS